MQEQQHNIILSLDANEPYDPDDSSIAPHLPYTPAFPTIDRHHNGKLGTLVSSCNLSDPLACQHSTRPFPASHIQGKGKKCIDYILVSSNLLQAVTSSGCLLHNTLMDSDHRSYFIDLDAVLLFSDPGYEIQPPGGWQLWLQDPRVVNKYLTTLHEQLKHHNILDRLETL
jgi:hypothetical protein